MVNSLKVINELNKNKNVKVIKKKVYKNRKIKPF